MAMKKKKTAKKSILIVEDCIEQAKVLRRLLVKEGYGVYVAKNGSEGLLKAKKQRPSLIISNIIMPVMDGYQMCCKLKKDKILKRIPVILLTKLTNSKDLLKELEANIECYITKPYKKEYLLSKIKYILNTQPHITDEDKKEKILVDISGKSYSVTASCRQFWNLLLSTYESAILQTHDLDDAKRELKSSHKLLEKKLNELQLSEERFRKVTHTIPDIIYQIDESGKFVFLNDAVRHLGYEPKNLLGKHFSKLILLNGPGNISRTNISEIYKGKKTGKEDTPKLFDERRTGERKTQGMEIKLIPKGTKRSKSAITQNPDENLIVAEASSSGMYEINPKTKGPSFAGTVGVIRDVTTRRKMEMDLKQMNEEIFRLVSQSMLKRINITEKKFDNLIKLSADAIIFVDESGNIILFNKAAEGIFGYKQKEIIGRPFISLLPKEYCKYYTRKFKSYLKTNDFMGTEETIELSIVTKNKFVKQIEMGLSATKVDNSCIFFGIMRDVTERKIAETALRESEEKLKTISNSVNDAIIMIDNEGRSLHWNRAAEQIFKYTAEEVMGKNVYELIVPVGLRKSFIKGFKKFKHTGQGPIVGKTVEFVAINKDGIEFPIEHSISAVKVKGKWNAVGIMKDITMRKRIEEELRLSYKLASLGRMTAGIFHEVLNPLNIISSHVQLLLMKAETGSDTENDLHSIQEEIDRIIKITDGLLRFARKGELEVEETNVNSLLEKVLFIVVPNMKLDNISFTKSLEEELPVIKANADELRQVFLNMITNARDAIPEGGTITISTQNIQKLENQFVRIRFMDTGCGISKENLDKIFDPFYTTKKEGKGTGLGLSTSYTIIEHHGGTLSVESEEGERDNVYYRFAC